MKIRRFFHSRVFLRYMAGYTVTFLLPVVVLCAILYQTNMNVLREEVYQTRMTSVLQFRRELDYEAQRFRSIGTQVGSDPNLHTILSLSRDKMTYEHTMYLKELKEKLFWFTYDMATPSVRGMSLYLRESGYYVDPSRATQLIDVEDSTFSIYGGVEAYREAIATTNSGAWMRCAGPDALLYVQVLPSLLYSEQAVLVIAIKPDFLSEYLAPLDDQVINCFLAPNGQALLSSDDALPELDLDSLTGDSGSVLHQDYTVYYATSVLAGYRYAVLMPNSALSDSLLSVQRMILGIFLISLVVCAPLTYAVTMYSYRPVDRLNALAVKDEDGGGGDEFDNIMNALVDAADRRSEYMDLKARERLRKRDAALERELLGPHALDALGRQTGLSRDALTGLRWCVVRVRYVDYTQAAEDEAMPYGLFISCREAFVKLSAHMFSVLPFGTDEELLLVGLAHERAQEVVRAQLEHTLQFLRDNYLVDCQTGVSYLHPAQEPFGETLKLMLEESRMALDVERLPGEAMGMCEQPDHQRTLFAAADQTFSRMMGAFRSNDVEEAERLRTLLAAQMSRIIRQMRAGANATDGGGDTPELTLKQRIIELVGEHYADCNLNVSAIADQLGKSPDYISRVFKQTTLIGLLDYIHHVRVGKAKKLMLSEPNLPLIQVSQCVGYASIDSFIRSFKRIEGTTPGRYRDQHRAQTLNANGTEIVD